MSDTDDLQRRGALGVLVLAVPVVSILAVGGAWLLLLGFGAAGRPADGPLVRIAFEGCAEAEPVVRARVDWMGLPEVESTPIPGGFALMARLPSDPATRARVPATLARTGSFVVREGAEGEVVATEADLLDATVVLGFLDAPKPQVQLTEAASKRLAEVQMADPEGFLTILVDGREVRRLENMPAVGTGVLMLDPGQLADRELVDFAAETALVLAHGPLPCPLAVADVAEVARP
ncbi:MAG: hypothetical protein H6732_16725 [Alphaproteobacteria bacterium]|nr:hypothetical protein [Alphaproteobacteria bacterium]